jgi:hypothetical protein
VKTSIVRDEAAARLKRASSLVGDAYEPKKVLVIDVGGTSVKLLVSGQHKRRMGDGTSGDVKVSRGRN